MNSFNACSTYFEIPQNNADSLGTQVLDESRATVSQENETGQLLQKVVRSLHIPSQREIDELHRECYSKNLAVDGSQDSVDQ